MPNKTMPAIDWINLIRENERKDKEFLLSLVDVWPDQPGKEIGSLPMAIFYAIETAGLSTSDYNRMRELRDNPPELISGNPVLIARDTLLQFKAYTDEDECFGSHVNHKDIDVFLDKFLDTNLLDRVIQQD